MAENKLIEFLPVIHQTTALKNFFENTVEVLYSQARADDILGFVGTPDWAGISAGTGYIPELTATKQAYSLSPVVSTINPDTGRPENLTFYDEFIDVLNTYGVDVRDHNKIFGEDYYSFMPPIDTDKLLNYQEYYWYPRGPATINIEPGADAPIDITNDIVGKDCYQAPDGTTLRNGMKIRFLGDYVIPQEFVGVEYIVEGVGESIILVPWIKSYITKFSTPTENPYDGTVINPDPANPDLRHTAGTVDSIEIYNGGVGYTDNAVATITPQGRAPGENFTSLMYSPGGSFPITLNDVWYTNITPAVLDIQTDANGSITSVDVLDSGDNYSQLVGVTVTDPGLTLDIDVEATTGLLNVVYCLDGEFANTTPAEYNLFVNNGEAPATVFDDPTYDAGDATAIPDCVPADQDIGNQSFFLYEVVLSDTNNVVPGQGIDIQIQGLTSLPETDPCYSDTSVVSTIVQSVDHSTRTVRLQYPVALCRASLLESGSTARVYGRNFHALVTLDWGVNPEFPDASMARVGYDPNSEYSGTIFQNRLFYLLGGDWAYDRPSEGGDDPGGIWDTGLTQGAKDYMLQQRGARNDNIWSRVNFWFHKNNFLDAGQELPGREFRAERPIIEFDRNVEMFNMGNASLGAVAVASSDFTRAELTGLGPSATVDGVPIVGATMIFPTEPSETAQYIYRGVLSDTGLIDPVTNIPVYETQLVRVADPVLNPPGAQDGDSDFVPIVAQPGEQVHITSGNTGLGREYIFTQNSWVLAQEKFTANQAPLFNLYDDTGTYLADVGKYPSSTFAGNKLFSYTVAQDVADRPSSEAVVGTQPDTELGFPLVFKQFKSSSEIMFTNHMETGEYTYTPLGGSTLTIPGYNYYRALGEIPEFVPYWRPADRSSQQNIHTRYRLTQLDVDREQTAYYIGGTPSVCEWRSCGKRIDVRVNNVRRTDFEYRDEFPGYIFFDQFNFQAGDFIEVSMYAQDGLLTTRSVSKFEESLSWQHNPLNENIEFLTEPEYLDHFLEYQENQPGFLGNPLGNNNFSNTGRNSRFAQTIVQTDQDILLAAFLLDDQPFNMVNALRFNANEYVKYKDRLRKEIERYTLDNDVDCVNLEADLEQILRKLIAFRVGRNVFNRTYQVPFGDNYEQYDLIINSANTTTLPTGMVADLDLIQNSVLVYAVDNNGAGVKTQLVVGRDYQITSQAPITVELLGDYTGNRIIVKLYNADRDSAQCPPTPSTLGLYPLSEPRIELDQSFSEPLAVLIGHDGSRTPTHGDARDSLMLEFERRIYNAAKKEFRDSNSVADLSVFDARPGAFRDTGYGYTEWYNLMRYYFTNFVDTHQLDPVINEFWQNSDPWTWNYRGEGDLPGHWRGFYEYYYDTVRPHTHPWEMLGFTEQPLWWTEQYGDYYGSGNQQMWNDLEQGIIRDGARENFTDLSYQNRNPYARPDLFQVLPVDENADLLPPSLIINTGVSNNELTYDNQITDSSQGFRTTAWQITDGLNISYDTDSVYVQSQGIPNYDITELDTGETITIKPRDSVYRIPREPTIGFSTGVPGSLLATPHVGVLVNGMPLNNINNACPVSYRDEGEWHYNVVYGDGFDYQNTGAVKENGSYEYYIIPPQVVGQTEFDDSEHSPIIGWALDGLPIYGPYGYARYRSDGAVADNTITNIQSPFVLRSGNRTSGPGGAHTGLFVEDYQLDPLLEGLPLGSPTVSGRTNRFNMRFGVTPDSPDTPIFFYVATQDDDGEPMFPYHVGGNIKNHTGSSTVWAGQYWAVPADTGGVSEIQITDCGYGYTFGVPGASAEITGDGRSARFELTRVNGAIRNIQVIQPGRGYDWQTTTAEIRGDGSGATCRPIVIDGEIVDFEITSFGSGYTQAYVEIHQVANPITGAVPGRDFVGNIPTVAADPANGIVDAAIVAATLESPGTDYTFADVEIRAGESSPGVPVGQGATAVAVLASDVDNGSGRGSLNPEALPAITSQGQITNQVTAFTGGSWTFSDGAPVENAWKYSEMYPYAVAEGLLLSRPGKFATFFSDPLALTRTTVDVNQVVSKRTHERWRFYDECDFRVHGDRTPDGDFITNIGYTQWLNSWLEFQGLNITQEFVEPMRTLNMRLGHRFSGFVDKDTMTVRTDQFNLGDGRGLVIQDDDLDVQVHSSQYKTRNHYTGVQIELVQGGYRVRGYDRTRGVFQILQPNFNGRSYGIDVGGEPAPFTEWDTGKSYRRTAIVNYQGRYYQSKVNHTSGDVFDRDLWAPLPSLPQIDAASAEIYQEFTNVVETVHYETVFTDIQDLVNFMVGLGAYQESLGYSFGEYEPLQGAVGDWVQACRQFLFWTTGRWEIGNTLNLSPLAPGVKFGTVIGFVSGIERIDREQFTLLDQNGGAIEPQDCEIIRLDDTVEIIPPVGKQIYACLLFTKEIDHVMTLSNRTQFGDVIYDPVLGQRQRRLKVKAKRSAGWRGRLEADGYVIRDDELKPNLDNLAQTMGRYTELGFVPVEERVYEVSRAQYGFQRRDYLTNLDILDEDQFDFYRGMLQNKGTISSLQKIANSSSVVQGSIDVFDEWAIKVGDFGDVQARQGVEFLLDRDDITQDPQLVTLSFPEDTTGIVERVDVLYRLARYDSPPQIVISPPLTALGAPAPGGRVARARATLREDGTLDTITVTDPGRGYDQGATGTVIVANVIQSGNYEITNLTDRFPISDTDITSNANIQVYVDGDPISNTLWTYDPGHTWLVNSNTLSTIQYVQSGNTEIRTSANITLSSADGELLSDSGNTVNNQYPFVELSIDGEIIPDRAYYYRSAQEYDSTFRSTFTVDAAAGVINIPSAKYLPDNLVKVVDITETIPANVTLVNAGLSNAYVVVENTTNNHYYEVGTDVTLVPGILDNQPVTLNINVVNNSNIWLAGAHLDRLTSDPVTYLGANVTILSTGPEIDLDREYTVFEPASVTLDPSVVSGNMGGRVQIDVATQDGIAVKLGRQRTFAIDEDIADDDIILIDIDDTTRFLKKPLGQINDSLWNTTTAVDATGITDPAYPDIPNAGYVNSANVNFQSYDIASLPDLFDPGFQIRPKGGHTIHLADSENSDWNVYRLRPTGARTQYIGFEPESETYKLYTDRSLFNYIDSNQIGTGDTSRYLDYYLTLRNADVNNNVVVWTNERIIQNREIVINNFRAPRMVEARIASIGPAEDSEFDIVSIQPFSDYRFRNVIATASNQPANSNVVVIQGLPRNAPISNQDSVKLISSGDPVRVTQTLSDNVVVQDAGTPDAVMIISNVNQIQEYVGISQLMVITSTRNPDTRMTIVDVDTNTNQIQLTGDVLTRPGAQITGAFDAVAYLGETVQFKTVRYQDLALDLASNPDGYAQIQNIVRVNDSVSFSVERPGTVFDQTIIHDGNVINTVLELSFSGGTTGTLVTNQELFARGQTSVKFTDEGGGLAPVNGTWTITSTSVLEEYQPTANANNLITAYVATFDISAGGRTVETGTYMPDGTVYRTATETRVDVLWANKSMLSLNTSVLNPGDAVRVDADAWSGYYEIEQVVDGNQIVVDAPYLRDQTDATGKVIRDGLLITTVDPHGISPQYAQNRKRVAVHFSYPKSYNQIYVIGDVTPRGIYIPGVLSATPGTEVYYDETRGSINSLGGVDGRTITFNTVNKLLSEIAVYDLDNMTLVSPGKYTVYDNRVVFIDSMVDPDPTVSREFLIVRDIDREQFRYPVVTTMDHDKVKLNGAEIRVGSYGTPEAMVEDINRQMNIKRMLVKPDGSNRFRMGFRMVKDPNKLVDSPDGFRRPAYRINNYGPYVRDAESIQQILGTTDVETAEITLGNVDETTSDPAFDQGPLFSGPTRGLFYYDESREQYMVWMPPGETSGSRGKYVPRTPVYLDSTLSVNLPTPEPTPPPTSHRTGAQILEMIPGTVPAGVVPVSPLPGQRLSRYDMAERVVVRAPSVWYLDGDNQPPRLPAQAQPVDDNPDLASVPRYRLRVNSDSLYEIYEIVNLDADNSYTQPVNFIQNTDGSYSVDTANSTVVASEFDSVTVAILVDVSNPPTSIEHDYYATVGAFNDFMGLRVSRRNPVTEVRSADNLAEGTDYVNGSVRLGAVEPGTHIGRALIPEPFAVRRSQGGNGTSARRNFQNMVFTEAVGDSARGTVSILPQVAGHDKFQLWQSGLIPGKQTPEDPNQVGAITDLPAFGYGTGYYAPGDGHVPQYFSSDQQQWTEATLTDNDYPVISPIGYTQAAPRFLYSKRFRLSPATTNNQVFNNTYDLASQNEWLGTTDVCVNPPRQVDVLGTYDVGMTVEYADGQALSGVQLLNEVNSTQANAVIVADWYTTVTNRPADRQGLHYWVDQIENSGLTQAEVFTNFQQAFTGDSDAPVAVAEGQKGGVLRILDACGTVVDGEPLVGQQNVYDNPNVTDFRPDEIFVATFWTEPYVYRNQLVGYSVNPDQDGNPSPIYQDYAGTIVRVKYIRLTELPLDAVLQKPVADTGWGGQLEYQPQVAGSIPETKLSNKRKNMFELVADTDISGGSTGINSREGTFDLGGSPGDEDLFTQSTQAGILETDTPPPGGIQNNSLAQVDTGSLEPLDRGTQSRTITGAPAAQPTARPTAVTVNVNETPDPDFVLNPPSVILPSPCEPVISSLGNDRPTGDCTTTRTEVKSFAFTNNYYMIGTSVDADGNLISNDGWADIMSDPGLSKWEYHNLGRLASQNGYVYIAADFTDEEITAGGITVVQNRYPYGEVNGVRFDPRDRRQEDRISTWWRTARIIRNLSTNVSRDFSVDSGDVQTGISLDRQRIGIYGVDSVPNGTGRRYSGNTTQALTRVIGLGTDVPDSSEFQFPSEFAVAGAPFPCTDAIIGGPNREGSVSDGGSLSPSLSSCNAVKGAFHLSSGDIDCRYGKYLTVFVHIGTGSGLINSASEPSVPRYYVYADINAEDTAPAGITADFEIQAAEPVVISNGEAIQNGITVPTVVINAQRVSDGFYRVPALNTVENVLENATSVSGNPLSVVSTGVPQPSIGQQTVAISPTGDITWQYVATSNNYGARNGRVIIPFTVSDGAGTANARAEIIFGDGGEEFIDDNGGIRGSTPGGGFEDDSQDLEVLK